MAQPNYHVLLRGGDYDGNVAIPVNSDTGKTLKPSRCPFITIGNDKPRFYERTKERGGPDGKMPVYQYREVEAV